MAWLILINFGSGNGSLPVCLQAITWISAYLLSIGSQGTNFSKISVEIIILSFKKTYLKISSSKCRPGLTMLNFIFQKMTVFQRQMEQFQSILQDRERDKTRWQQVGDVMLEALQDEIDQCKVRRKWEQEIYLWTHFRNGLWAYNWNLQKILYVLIFIANRWVSERN